MSDGSVQVNTEVLRDLAGRAITIGGDIGALGASMPELDGAAAGSGSVSGALADFVSAMLDRTAALQAEFDDAAEFLNTFADTMTAVDEGAAGA